MSLIRKIYYKIKYIYVFLTKIGFINYSTEISSLTMNLKIERKKIILPLKSFKILNRINNFVINKNDLVYQWLRNLKNCKVFYDIGSANGLEGFFVNTIHNSKVIFFESYIPSLDELIKGIYLFEHKLYKLNKFELITAPCDKELFLKKFLSHTPPKSGYTFNSLDNDPRDNALWKNRPIISSNWINTVTIDDIIFKYKFEIPDYIKIDVDGYELNVLKGSQKILKKGYVKEWMIEVHKKNEEEIYEIMKKNNYKEVKKNIHFYEKNKYTCWDSLFVKNV